MNPTPSNGTITPENPSSHLGLGLLLYMQSPHASAPPHFVPLVRVTSLRYGAFEALGSAGTASSGLRLHAFVSLTETHEMPKDIS